MPAISRHKKTRLRGLLELGAGGGTRTHTVSPQTDFESAASTNSATPAVQGAHHSGRAGDAEDTASQRVKEITDRRREAFEVDQERIMALNAR